MGRKPTGSSMVAPPRGVSAFFSYSHRDQSRRDRLEKHMSVLKRERIVTCWHDRLILPGTDFAAEIDDRINTADIVLLLISADFLASNYCYEIECESALSRHSAGEARVVPIILRPADWKNTPLGGLQALPRDGKPVSRWSDQDQAFLDIVEGIRRIVRELAGNPHTFS